MNKDTFYFSHDYNVRTDFKIKRLIAKHGMTGYGVFWAIIEELYNNANALQSDYEVIAYELRVDEKMVKSIINDYDLFIFDGDTFGSLSVEKRLEKRNNISNKNRDNARARWDKQKREQINIDAVALQSDSGGNAKGKERKGKEKKEESIHAQIFNFTKALISIGVLPETVKDYLLVRKKKKAVNSEKAFEGLVREINKSGLTAEQCITLCVEKSWSGFDHTWQGVLDKKNKVITPIKETAESITDAHKLIQLFKEEMKPRCHPMSDEYNNMYETWKEKHLKERVML